MITLQKLIFSSFSIFIQVTLYLCNLIVIHIQSILSFKTVVRIEDMISKLVHIEKNLDLSFSYFITLGIQLSLHCSQIT